MMTLVTIITIRLRSLISHEMSNDMKGAIGNPFPEEYLKCQCAPFLCETGTMNSVGWRVHRQSKVQGRGRAIDSPLKVWNIVEPC